MLTTIMFVVFAVAMALPGLITILLAGPAEEVRTFSSTASDIPPSPLAHGMQPSH